MAGPAESGQPIVEAYNLATRTRHPEFEFGTPSAIGNNDIISMWGGQDTLWMADSINEKVYTYNTLRNNFLRPPQVPHALYNVHSDERDTALSLAWPFPYSDTLDPLTGSIPDEHLPESHDGTNTFTLQIHFSESPVLSYVNVNDHILDVENGEATKARRVTQGSNQAWEIIIKPEGNAAVVITLPATTGACTANAAVCMSDGRKLSNDSTATVPRSGE